MKLFSLVLVLIASSFFVVAPASATGVSTYPHYLTGSVLHRNNSVLLGKAYSAEIVTNYNTKFNNLSACNAAKDRAEDNSVQPVINPVGQVEQYGQFTTVSTLKCDPIK